MGFIDAKTMVSNKQRIQADAASTSSIDLTLVTTKRKVGEGEPMCFAVAIPVAGTTTGSMDIQVIESATEDLATPTVLSLRRLATADLAAGKFHTVDIPQGAPRAQFVGLFFDITGTVDVTVTAWMTPRSMVASPTEAYQDAINIA